MNAAALKDEAFSLINDMPENKIKTVVQFVRFIYQQPDENTSRNNRDEKDFALINAHVSKFNDAAEENLEFQADIWGD